MQILLRQHKFKVPDVLNKTIPNKILFILNAQSLLALKQKGQIILSHIDYFSKLKFEIYLLFYFLDEEYNQEINEDLVNNVNSLIHPYKINKIWYLSSLNSTPKYLKNLDKDQYLLDVYDNKLSFTRNLIQIHTLQIPDSIHNYLLVNKPNLILIDSIENQIIINNLPLANTPVIYQFLKFRCYEYSLLNNQEVNDIEWNYEKSLYNQISLVFSVSEHQGENIKNIAPHISVYNLPKYHLINDPQLSLSTRNILPIIWGKNQHNYQQIINKSIEQIIDKLSFRYNLKSPNKKIAILYPWGDILERKSGASQRVGLLLDFLMSKGYHIWFFTIGQEKELLFDQVRYNFYEPQFSQLELVKRVYSNSYENLINTNQLNNNQAKSDLFINTDNLDKITQDWRLSMYNQFTFDSQFSEKIAEIVDWADIVLLEYPFWSKSVSKKIRFCLVII